MYYHQLFQMASYEIPSWYYVSSHPVPIQYYSPYTRQFPPVDPTQFQKSASRTSLQINDSKKIIDRISASRDFAHRLMGAAQLSKKNEVKRLIASTGVQRMPGIDYTPDGLLLTFTDKQYEIECCKLRINIRWS